MVKKPSQQATTRTGVTAEQAEALAQRLADKPYGAPEKPEPEKQCRTTISLGGVNVSEGRRYSTAEQA